MKSVIKALECDHSLLTWL